MKSYSPKIVHIFVCMEICIFSCFWIYLYHEQTLYYCLLMNKMNPQETQEKTSNDIIRKVTIADIPEMARINVECWKHNYKGIVAQDVLDDMSVEKHIKRRTENFEEMQKNQVFYLKEIDGKIAGFIS